MLDRVLVDAAREAGAEVREGYTVDEVLMEDGRVTGIRGRTAEGHETVERAPIVVGAALAVFTWREVVVMNVLPGLVVALLMATTGTIGYLLWAKGTAMTGLARAAFQVHVTLANVMWGYVIVHVGATLLHELLGHRVLRQMSPMRHAGSSDRSWGNRGAS